MFEGSSEDHPRGADDGLNLATADAKKSRSPSTQLLLALGGCSA